MQFNNNIPFVSGTIINIFSIVIVSIILTGMKTSNKPTVVLPPLPDALKPPVVVPSTSKDAIANISSIRVQGENSGATIRASDSTKLVLETRPYKSIVMNNVQSDQMDITQKTVVAGELVLDTFKMHSSTGSMRLESQTGSGGSIALTAETTGLVLQHPQTINTPSITIEDNKLFDTLLADSGMQVATNEPVSQTRFSYRNGTVLYCVLLSTTNLNVPIKPISGTLKSRFRFASMSDGRTGIFHNLLKDMNVGIEDVNVSVQAIGSGKYILVPISITNDTIEWIYYDGKNKANKADKIPGSVLIIIQQANSI